MRFNEVSRNFVDHIILTHLLCRCRHSVQFSLHCAWLLQSYSVDANLSTKKKSQGGRKNNLYFAQKISDANIEPFWHSYQYPHPPLTPLSCLLWISANFAFKENWANFIQTNSNESWAHIISGTRLRNLILSGELVPKDLSPSSGGADDWKTSFQGREIALVTLSPDWVEYHKSCGNRLASSPRPWINILIWSSLHQLEALQLYILYNSTWLIIICI